MKSAPTGFSPKQGFARPNGPPWMTRRTAVLIEVTWLRLAICRPRRRWPRVFHWQTWCLKRQNITGASGRSRSRWRHENMRHERLATFMSLPGLLLCLASPEARALVRVRCEYPRIYSSWSMTRIKTGPGRTGISMTILPTPQYESARASWSGAPGLSFFLGCIPVNEAKWLSSGRRISHLRGLMLCKIS